MYAYCFAATTSSGLAQASIRPVIHPPTATAMVSQLGDSLSVVWCGVVIILGVWVLALILQGFDVCQLKGQEMPFIG